MPLPSAPLRQGRSNTAAIRLKPHQMACRRLRPQAGSPDRLKPHQLACRRLRPQAGFQPINLHPAAAAAARSRAGPTDSAWGQ